MSIINKVECGVCESIIDVKGSTTMTVGNGSERIVLKACKECIVKVKEEVGKVSTSSSSELYHELGRIIKELKEELK